MLDLLDRLSPAERLQLLAFDADLRRLPRPFLDALCAGVDALERPERGPLLASTDRCRLGDFD